jgi:hypothetical protein
MAATRTDISGLLNIATGSRVFGPVTVADNVVGFQLELARSTLTAPTIWPNVLTTVSVTFAVSFDGGVTWIIFGGFESSGGIYVDRHGVTPEFIYYSTSLPPGVGRQVRANTVVQGGPLRTRVSIVTDTVPGDQIVRP